MNKLLILGLLVLPAQGFCMESGDLNRGFKKEETNVDLLDLPQDILVKELVEKIIIDLIKDCNSSNNTNRLQEFFAQFNNLFINKQMASLLRRYVPAKQESLAYIAKDESLLVFAAKREWYNLVKLILENTTPSQRDLNFAALWVTDTKVAQLLASYGGHNVFPFDYLPNDIRRNEVCKAILTSIIEEYMNSTSPNKINYFFTRIKSLKLVNKEFCKFVLSYIPSDFVVNDGQTLLSMAILKGLYNLVDIILGNFSLNDEQKKYAVIAAVEVNNLKLAREIFYKNRNE